MKLYIFYDRLNLDMDKIVKDFYNKINNTDKMFINVIDNNDIDIINKIYKVNIDKIPSIALSFNNVDYNYLYEFIYDKFVVFYKKNKNDYLIQNIDMICSNLRNNVNRAIYNNRSDYIDLSNRSINDIIELIYALKNKNNIT